MQPDPGKQRHDEPFSRSDRRGEIQDLPHLQPGPRGQHMNLRRVLILADESADWMVAGLRQLDRLALAVDEFAVENGETSPVVVCIFWRSDLDQSQRWIPADPRLTHIAFRNDVEAEPYDLVLSTRLFLYRKSVRPLLEQPPPL